jgi:nucleoredoxin
MRCLVFFVLFLGILGTSRSAQLPLTTRDVSLMLRSGYSSGTVIEELSKRHFADSFDALKESALVKSGATPALVDALKSGTYSVSLGEAGHLQEQMVRQSIQSQMAIERTRKADSILQAQLARERKPKAPQTVSGNVIYNAVKGDLVSFHNGTIGPTDEEGLADKKLIALYFSAHWCGPCRQFTPELVDYYNRVAPQHPELELIFVSRDRSLYGMQTYMRETNMPWPALDFGKVDGNELINKYAGKGIPCLVLVDSSGKVVSDSYTGSQYVGPKKVLADLDAIFAGGGQSHLAQRR